MAEKRLSSKFMKAVKKNLTFNAFVFLIWLVLGWLRSYGITSLILFPFNFLTGALIGVDGGSFFKGVVGKTLILILLNSLVRPLLFSTGGKKEKMKKALAAFKASSLRKIPQYTNISQLIKANALQRGYGLMGFGIAFLVYPIVTGDGSFQNTGVCLLAAIALFRQLKSNRGLIMAIVTDVMKKQGRKPVNKDMVNRLVNGNALGFASTVVYSLIGLNVDYASFFGFMIFLMSAGMILMKNNGKAVQRTASLLVVLLLIASNGLPVFASLLYDNEVNTMEEFREVLREDHYLTEVLLSGDSGVYMLAGDELNEDGTLTLDSETEKSFNIVYRQDVDRYDEFYQGPNRPMIGIVNSEAYDTIEINGQYYYIDEIIEEQLTIQQFALNKTNELGTFSFRGAYIIMPFISQEIIDEAMITNNWDRYNALSEERHRMDASGEGDVRGIYYNFFPQEGKTYLGFDLVNDSGEVLLVVNGQEIIKTLIPSTNIIDGWSTEDGEAGISFDVPIKILKGYYDTTDTVAGPIEVTTVALLSLALATSASGAISGLGSTSSGFSVNGDESEDDASDESEDDAGSFSMVINNDELMPPLCNVEKASVVVPVSIEDGDGMAWRFSVVPYPVRPDIFIPSIINFGQDNTAQLSIFLTGKSVQGSSLAVILHVNAVAKENGRIIGKAHKTIQATLYNLGLSVALKDEADGYVKGNMTVTEVTSSKIKGIAEIKNLKDEDYNIDGETIRQMT